MASKLSRGTVRKQTLAPTGWPKRVSNDISMGVQTRVGMQAKYGQLKATAPGQRWNVPKKLGG
jgi:hypothetical protein